MENDYANARSVAGINFILGIWLIISPWIFNYTSGGAKWNQFAFGIAVAVLAGIRYLAPSQVWTSWINVLIGIWMIIAPFIISYQRTAAYWNEVLVGIAVALLALSNLSYSHGHRGHHSAA